jgi:tripartite-type tricarboxylate transporter receptor subunit TctC
MVINRRTVATAALALPFGLASCQREQSPAEREYPAGNITFIIPVAAGGGLDVYARLIGGAMEGYLPRKVSIVPENEPSGGGGKGVSQLFRAEPDGYTIGMLNVPGIFVLQRLRRMPYDFGQFSWLGTLSLGENYCIAVSGNSPVQTFDDLLAVSRERELTFATTGPEGTSYTSTVIATHLLGIRARLVTGYRSSTDYVIGALRRDTDAVIATLSVVDRLHGQLRVLASFERESSIPGIPDAVDLGYPELENLMGVRCFAAPPGTPDEIVETISQAILKAMSDERVVSWARNNGDILSPQTPQQTREAVLERRAFLEKWGDTLSI